MYDMTLLLFQTASFGHMLWHQSNVKILWFSFWVLLALFTPCWLISSEQWFLGSVFLMQLYLGWGWQSLPQPVFIIMAHMLARSLPNLHTKNHYNFPEKQNQPPAYGSSICHCEDNCYLSHNQRSTGLNQVSLMPCLHIAEANSTQYDLYRAKPFQQIAVSSHPCLSASKH